MTTVLRMMVASSGVEALPARVEWPLHDAMRAALAEADSEAGGLGFVCEIHADPDVYVRVVGLAEAFRTLEQTGFVSPCGEGYLATWLVTSDAAVSARRDLLREPADTARVIAQAGQRLATSVSTVLKNAQRAARSWGPIVASSSPTRLQLEAGSR